MNKFKDILDKLHGVETKINNKHLAYVFWILASLQLITVFAFQSLLYLHPYLPMAVQMIIQLITVATFAAVGCVMYANTHNTRTKVVLIVFAVFNFNINIAILITMMLGLKYIKNEKAKGYIKKAWFVPGIISAYGFVTGIVNVISYSEFFSSLQIIITILANLAAILAYLALGHWITNVAQFKNKKMIKSEKELAFYEDLHNRGVITAEELIKKKMDIENK